LVLGGSFPTNSHLSMPIVLGGAAHVRPFAAAERYRRCYASKILVSNVKLGGAEQLGNIPSDVQLNRDVLLKLGVPASVVVSFGNNLISTHKGT
jgi:hypothetical protein